MGQFKKPNRNASRQRQSGRLGTDVSKLFKRAAKDHPQTVAYFKKVTKQTYDPEVFKANWHKMENLELSADDLTKALGAAARLLGGRALGSSCSKQSLEHKDELKSFLDAHFEKWLLKMQTAGLDTFGRDGLARMIWDLGGINIWPGENFIDQWQDAAEKFLSDDATERFRDSDLSKILHGLCTIDAQVDHIDLKNLIGEFTREWEDIDDTAPQTVQSYFDACLWIGREPQVKSLSYSHYDKSRSEKQLRNLLRKIDDVRFYPEEGDNDPDNHVISSHPVDIPFEWRGHKILMEYDGPYHFTRPPENFQDNGDSVFNGATAFRTRLLSRCNPDACVIRFPFSEDDWLTENCTKTKDKLYELECMLHDVTDQGPGCYVATSQSGELSVRPLSTQPTILNEPVSYPCSHRS